MAGFELYAPRSPRARRTWTWAIIVLGIVLITVAQTIAFMPQIIAGVQYAHAHPGMRLKLAIPMEQLTLSDVPFILLIFAWIIWVERRPLSAIGFNSKPVVRFVRGWLIGAGFLAAVVCGLWAVGVYVVAGPGVWQAPSWAVIWPIVMWIGLYIVQGSAEEIWMRGWLLGNIASRHGIVWAVVISGVVFGAIHLGNPGPWTTKIAGCSNIVLFGFFIAMYAARERSIWGVCGFHAAWNWLLGVGFGLDVSGLQMNVTPLVMHLKDAAQAPWWLTGGEWGPEASLMCTAVLIVGCAYMLARKALTPGDSFAVPVPPAPDAQIQANPVI